MKITSFRDIPQRIRDGNYEIDVSIGYLKETIDGYIKEYSLEMTPDFQRGHVWTKEQQIAYVEFLFSGGKSARVIYFNCPDFGNRADDSDMEHMVLVDGLQRLTALLDFVDDKIPVFGSYYSEFTDRPRYIQGVKFNVNSLQYRRDVLKWYIEMNTGGVVHTKSEIDRVRSLLDDELKKRSDIE